MDVSLKDKEKVLTKAANRIEKECGIKNGAFFLTLVLLLMDTDTWIVDKSWLTRAYQAIDLIERNDELKKLFNRKEVEEDVVSEEAADDGGGSKEASDGAGQGSDVRN